MPILNQLDYLFCPYCAKKLDVKIEGNRQRKFCHACNWTYYPKLDIAVAGVITKIIGKERKVLMVRRNREPFKGTWMFPAGFMEYGEHPRETLRRELMEETGLVETSSKLISILRSTRDPRSPQHLVIFYHTQGAGYIKNNDSEENSSIEWKSINDSCIDIGFPHHKFIFGLVRSEQDRFFDQQCWSEDQVVQKALLVNEESWCEIHHYR